MAQPCEELSLLLVMMGPDYKNNLDVKTKHELWFSTEDPTLKILTLSPSPYSKYLYSEHDKLKSLLRSLAEYPHNLVPEPGPGIPA